MPLGSLLLVAAMKPMTLVFGGDVMLNGVRPGVEVFADISATFRKADLTFANLEIPLTDARTPTTRKSAEELRKRDQFILKADPAHAKFLSDAGIKFVSLGNNHAMDYGPSGLRQMVNLLRRNKISYSGAGENLELAKKVVVRKARNGQRVGLISAMAYVTTAALEKTWPATESQPGVHGLDLNGWISDRSKEAIRLWVQEAKSECDFLVVGLHWGTERKPLPNRYQVELGRAFADAGADVVWGHHPHVLQGMEVYNRVPILYSMGNLISSLPSETGLIRMTWDGRNRTIEFLPARIRNGRLERQGSADSVRRFKEFSALCAKLSQSYPQPKRL